MFIASAAILLGLWQQSEGHLGIAVQPVSH
jgi:hypothetical protein